MAAIYSAWVTVVYLFHPQTFVRLGASYGSVVALYFIALSVGGAFCWLSMESLPLSDRRLRSQHRGRRNCRFWSRLHSAGEPGWVGFGRVAWHASVWIRPWDLFRRVALQGGEEQLARLGFQLKYACAIAARGTVAYDTTIDVQHRLGLIQ